MRIAQIIPSFNIGGGELLAVRLCAEIRRQQPDCDVHLISLYDPIPTIVYDEALSSGATIRTLGKKKGFDPLVSLRMVSTLKAIKPDVIHTHLAGLRYTLGAAVIFRKALKIHTVHNMAAHETFRLLQRLHYLAFKRLGWIPVALSAKVQQSIHDVYGLDAPIVTNGIKVDSSVFIKQKDELRRKCRLPIDHPIIVTIGRLLEQKNHGLLIDAFQELFGDRKGCSLLIVGDDTTGGSYRKKLEDKVNTLPGFIRDNVYFLGPRKDIPELLMASDIFVLSSDWEGVPLTLLEAMGYGIPVVCTSVGGIPDVIEHGINGLLVPKGDVGGLANAISTLLFNKPYAISLARNAQNKFKQLYSIEMTANAYMELYKRKLKNVECV